MTPLKRNLSRLLFLTLVLTLGGAIFGVVYYLKMDRNEDTLNTLLFRELQQVEGTIQRSLEKVQATAKYTLPEKYVDYQKAGAEESKTGTLTDREARLKVLKEASKANFNKLQNSSSDLADIKVHSVDESYSCGEKGQEQGVFSFTIPEFNTVRFTLSKHYPNEHKVLVLTLESSIHYSLKQRVNRFQTVALVNGNGEVKSVVNHSGNLNNASELFIRDVLNISQGQNGAVVAQSENSGARLANAQIKSLEDRADAKLKLEGTRFEDVRLNDSDYRVYLHPVTSKGLSADKTRYYLLGVLKKSEVNEQKLKLAPDLLMWLILVLLLLIAVIPLIKLRFISATSAIQKGDKSQIVLGLMVSVGVITIGFSQHFFFDYLMSVKERQLARIFANTKQEFNTELGTLLTGISEVKSDKKSEEKFSAHYKSVLDPEPLIFLKDSPPGKAFVESITSLDKDGEINNTEQKPIIMMSEVVKYTQNIDLTPREYVKAGQNGDYWKFSKTRPFCETPVWEMYERTKLLDDNLPYCSLFYCPVGIVSLFNGLVDTYYPALYSNLCATPVKSVDTYHLYLQRVFNIEDGRRNLMLALDKAINPDLGVAHEGAKKPTHMFIAGTRLSALIDRVLPIGFGYAVIEKDGDVLFHSDDSLSLIENFFAESNQNPELLLASKHEHSATPTLINVEYKGEPIKLVIGSLAEQDSYSNVVSGIPWKLIIYFNPQGLQTNNMVLVFVAVLLFLVVLIPSFILLRYVTHQRFWQEVCGYDTEREKYYLALGFLLFAASVFTQFQMGWVQSILGRLLLWAILCAVIAYLLVAVFKLRLVFFYWWRQPLLAFSLLLLPLITMNWLFDSGINFKKETVNWVSAGLGGLFLIGSIAFFLRKIESTSAVRIWLWIRIKVALLSAWVGVKSKYKLVLTLLFSIVCGLIVCIYMETDWSAVIQFVWRLLKIFIWVGFLIVVLVASLKAEKWYKKIEKIKATKKSIDLISPTNNAMVVAQAESSDHTKTQKYRRESTRFSKGYVFFLTGMVYLGASTPASLVAYSAHDYLLQRQSQFEEAHIRSEIEQKEQGFAEYIKFITRGVCQSPDNHTLCNLTLKIDFNDLLRTYFPRGAFCPKDLEGCKSAWAGLYKHEKVSKTIQQNTDNVFDLLFSKTPSETEFISHLSYAAKQDLKVKQDSHSAVHTDADDYELRYRTDLLMMSAISNNSGAMIMLLMMFGLPYGLYMVTRQLIVKRLLGEHIQDQYRVRKGCDNDTLYAREFPRFNVSSNGHSLLVLNTTRLCAERELKKAASSTPYMLYENNVFRVVDSLNKYYSSTQHGDVFYFMSELEKWLVNHNEPTVVVAISGLEQVSCNEELRKDALGLLYELHLHSRVLLVIVAETAPLYRLLHPEAYEACQAAPDIDEKTGWTKLFSECEKHYAWSPVCKQRVGNPFDIKQLLHHECWAWPEIVALKEAFITHTIKSNFNQRVSKQIRVRDLKAPVYNECWEPEQLIEFMLVHAGPLYRRKWEECTVKEKLILWKMAHGASINPESAVTIERLVRRCYLFRDKGWHIVNESFRQFIITAEPDSVVKGWMDNSSSGVWSVLRIPIFAVLLVLLAIFIYSSGSSLNSLLSIATATLGLIPLLIKNLSLLRGGGTEIE